MKIDNSLALLHSQAKVSSDISGKDDAALKEKTDQFEAILIKMLLDNAMKDENPLFGKDPSNKIYQSMFREELSKEAAGGFGFSEILFNHLVGKK